MLHDLLNNHRQHRTVDNNQWNLDMHVLDDGFVFHKENNHHLLDEHHLNNYRLLLIRKYIMMKLPVIILNVVVLPYEKQNDFDFLSK